MTVSTAYDPLTFTGDASTVSFAVTWPFYTGSLVVTEIVTATGVETVKTISTHYTVSGGTDANGLPATGTVTAVTAPAATVKWRIERVTPRTQATAYTNNDAFPAKTTESAFDKALLIGQEALYQADRAVKVTTANREAGVDPVLPAAVADKLLGWNSDADGLENKAAADLDLSIVSEYAEGLLGAANAAAARTVLGLSQSGDMLAANNLSDVASASTSRTNLSAAASGANTDLTSVYLNNTGLKVKDTNASHGLSIVPGSDLTADRVLTIATGDAARTLTLGADVTMNASPIAQGLHSIWVPASAMIAATTSGPASAQIEETTNKQNYKVADYDASADEYLHFQIAFPKSWNLSTVSFQVFWRSTATDTDGVAWGLEGVAVGDGDAIDAAFGTPVLVTDAAQSANSKLYVTAISSAVTIAGTPAVGDLVFFRLFRDVSDAADTHAEDARLIGVKVLYTINAATDA